MDAMPYPTNRKGLIMTVYELIKILTQYDAETEVTIYSESTDNVDINNVKEKKYMNGKKYLILTE
jgi:hypothetical protein